MLNKSPIPCIPQHDSSWSEGSTCGLWWSWPGPDEASIQLLELRRRTVVFAGPQNGQVSCVLSRSHHLPCSIEKEIGTSLYFGSSHYPIKINSTADCGIFEREGYPEESSLCKAVTSSSGSLRRGAIQGNSRTAIWRLEVVWL